MSCGLGATTKVVPQVCDTSTVHGIADVQAAVGGNMLSQ